MVNATTPPDLFPTNIPTHERNSDKRDRLVPTRVPILSRHNQPTPTLPVSNRRSFSQNRVTNPKLTTEDESSLLVLARDGNERAYEALVESS